jgi:hypothetical protein
MVDQCQNASSYVVDTYITKYILDGSVANAQFFGVVRGHIGERRVWGKGEGGG